MSRNYCTILDYKIFGGERIQAIEKISERAKEKNFYHVSFVNSLRLQRTRYSKKSRALYGKINLLLPNGRGICWASRRYKEPLADCFSPIDLMMDLIRSAISNKQTIFFLGTTQDSLNLAIDKLRQSFPDLKIVGSHHGFFSAERSGDIVKAVKKFSPDYLFVGMGHPLQDRWIQENRKFFPETVCISVGNAFDLCAGIKNRGPVWYRKKGLEGLFKAFQNPLRFWKLPVFPLFIFSVLWDTIIRKKGKNGRKK